MISGLDVSHFQGAPNMAAIKAAGRDFIVLKATEGVGYTDPTFAANRKAAHAAGLVVGIYHFGRDNSPTAEAAYFANVVGALQPGEFLVLDQEIVHAGGNVAWCQAWLDATRARYGIAPLVYMNVSSNTGTASGNWTALAQTYGLWLAKYDNAPTVQNAVPYWGVPAMKQYSDAGSVPGVAGTCDVDSFYGTRDQLLAYGKGGVTPPPTPLGGFFMALSDAQQVEVYNNLRLVTTQMCGQTFLADGQWGWPTADGKKTTLVDMLRGLFPSKAAASVNVDPAALAAALLADESSVARLGDAIAAGLAKRVGNG